MSFASTAKVQATCKLKYYRIAECAGPSFGPSISCQFNSVDDLNGWAPAGLVSCGEASWAAQPVRCCRCASWPTQGGAGSLASTSASPAIRIRVCGVEAWTQPVQARLAPLHVGGGGGGGKGLPWGERKNGSAASCAACLNQTVSSVRASGGRCALHSSPCSCQPLSSGFPWAG